MFHVRQHVGHGIIVDTSNALLSLLTKVLPSLLTFLLLPELAMSTSLFCVLVSAVVVLHTIYHCPVLSCILYVFRYLLR